MRKWWAIAVPAALSLSACAPTTETRQDKVGVGVVSTSLCGDGYLLESRQEIAALSWQSDGPLSRVDGGYPKASTDVETLVALQPDVLLLGPGERVREGLLPDTQIIQLDWAEDFAGVEANRKKLVPGLDPGPPSPEGQPAKTTLLYLSRAGGTAGPGTYVDAAIRAAGARNLVTQPGWFTPDPEWVVAQDPDAIVTSFFDGYESINASAARNRAVAEFIAARPRIDVPGKLWPCAGPGLEEAVEFIREGLER